MTSINMQTKTSPVPFSIFFTFSVPTNSRPYEKHFQTETRMSEGTRICQALALNEGVNMKDPSFISKTAASGSGSRISCFYISKV